ncbi:MAG: hypothetical protein EPN86_02260 [Nanoarchaeota archaeon]|nr:MAG: hypothetical protein EPN86_02260 [Nanoarchaeota archaeon]
MQPYVVMYERDARYPLIGEDPSHPSLYDSAREFRELGAARNFASAKMADPALLVKCGSVEDENSRGNFVVAGYFPDKYKHYDYGGGSDSVPTHEVVRCSREALEQTLATFSSNVPKKIIWGIELKIIE